MNYVRRYCEGDLQHVGCRDEAWEPINNILAASSWSWTLCDSQGPWAICGAYKHWDGCASVWMQVDPRVKGLSKSVFMTKTCKELIRLFCDEKEVMRVDCLVDDRYHNYDKWAYILGFQYEYTMKNASPKCSSDVHGLVYWRE